MILLQKTLATLAALFSSTGLWLAIWVAVLVGFSIFLWRISRQAHRPRPWVVRKGECPFCSSELFGTTREYQRFSLLATLAPESQYLCMDCDKEKVAGLLSRLEEER